MWIGMSNKRANAALEQSLNVFRKLFGVWNTWRCGGRKTKHIKSTITLDAQSRSCVSCADTNSTDCPVGGASVDSFQDKMERFILHSIQRVVHGRQILSDDGGEFLHKLEAPPLHWRWTCLWMPETTSTFLMMCSRRLNLVGPTQSLIAYHCLKTDYPNLELDPSDRHHKMRKFQSRAKSIFDPP